MRYFAYIYKTVSLQRNNGQSTGPAGVDLNVLGAWQQGYNGKGVVVSVLDDGKNMLQCPRVILDATV